MPSPKNPDGVKVRQREARAWVSRALSAASLGLAAAVISVLPSVAAPPGVVYKDSALTCNSYGQCVQAEILKGQGYVWGAGYYQGLHAGTSATMTIVVYQCSGTGSNCGAMSASKQAVTTNSWAKTSSKDLSFGHTYRTCVSGAGLVNVCTPLLA